MNRTEQNPEALLDAAIADVRNDQPDPAAMAEAARRVWARLNVDTAAEPVLSCCEDYQKLFAQYREGTLTPSRHLLVQDHLHECVRCRKAFHPVTVRMTPAMVSEMPQRRTSPKRWLMAAAAAAVVSSLSFYAYEMMAPVPGGGRMQLVSAAGPVYKVHKGTAASVTAGEQFELGQTLRTSGGGRAMIRLHDGSVVEVSERAELNVHANRRDTTVNLLRGNIIVQAAKRDRGHLYVGAQDSRVAVTGTVFSVSRGMRGSRVSVIEGSVDVSWRGNEQSLKPGDQITTDSSLGRVPVEQEIAWSTNYDKHLALLKQFVDLGGKLKHVEVAGLRYGSRLLEYVPENTTVYVSLPNLGKAIGEVQRIVSAQSTQSPELREWLRTQFPDFEKAAKQIETLGEYLGEEIVVSFADCKGFCGVFVADVNRAGLREYLQKELPAGAPIRVVDLNNLPAAAPADGMIIALSGNRVFMGQAPDRIRMAAAGNSRFAQTDFGRSVSDAYRRGTGLLVAANLAELVKHGGAPAGMFTALGIDRVRHLIAEQREMGGRPTYSAVVSFDGQRRGVASWLAQPGSMGGLGFVSPNALFATAWVVKDPAQMLQDALALMRTGPAGDLPIDEFEAKTGVNPRDLASALGGEAVFALDGPMIPTPAWRLVLEVKDQARVQDAIQKMIATANRELREGKVEITSGPLDTKGSGLQDLTAYSLRMPAGNVVEAHYAYVDGYLVMASSVAFLQRAIVDRRSGVSLARSGEFRSLLPGGEQVNASGIVYQNAGELLRLIASGAADVAGNSPDRQKQVAELANGVEPGLIAVYGNNDRIEIASRTNAMSLLGNSMVSQILGFAQKKGTTPQQRSYR